MYNLFISYQINDHKQDFTLLKRAINSLGNMTQVHASCWYVNSAYDAEEAIKRVGSVIKKDAKLLVIDASSNQCLWIGIGDTEAARIRQNWLMSLKNEEAAPVDEAASAEAEEAEEEALEAEAEKA